jgi:hypothetical protein
MRYLRITLVREAAILFGLIAVAVALTAPMSLHPDTMVPDPSDPLLSAWRMHWVQHALLSGADSLRHLFDANIFYPYPMTLAFSEHLLGETAFAFPLLLVAQSHLFGLNISVLVSFVLTAYATYLLVAEWTRSRAAGLFAGFLMAFSPFRFGQIIHLEILVTQWMPLTLLSLHWLLIRRRAADSASGSSTARSVIYLALFIIFFNSQALSSVYNTAYLAVACAVMVVVYGLAGRITWRWTLLADGGLFGGIAFLVNWPQWRIYFHFSELMGAVRTPGDVRVYSAALADYLTTIPQNLLYGWTFGYWQLEGHQYQPLMPVGVAGLALAVIGVASLARASASRGRERWTGALLLALVLIGFVLSLGTNEQAFGPALAPALARLLPYGWLYEHLPGLMGLRVPARSGVLVVLGLSGLAGMGIAAARRALGARHARLGLAVLPAAAGVVALVECWSVPLSGPEFADSRSLAPVYGWLLNTTEPDSVVLELPQQGASESAYEYYSTYHWRKLVNGSSGYAPPAHRELREFLKTFPDWRTVDVIQQMGVDYIVLHQPDFAPDAWEQIQGQLPGFLPAFDGIHQVGSSLVLHVAQPSCRADAQQLRVHLSLAQEAEVTVSNVGPATFVSDVTRPSQLLVNGHPARQFLLPLLTVPGQSRDVAIEMDSQPGGNDRVQARIPELGAVLTPGQPALSPETIPTLTPEQPIGLKYVDGPELVGLAVPVKPLRTCGTLYIGLHWQAGYHEDQVVVEVVDRFARVVLSSQSHPWRDGLDSTYDVHRLPLPGSLPAGEYGLRVKVTDRDERERRVIAGTGEVFNVDQLPTWPIVVRPASPSEPAPGAPLAVLDDVIDLLDLDLPQSMVAQGDWLRFSLLWQVRDRIERDLTVFTQLIGPDGKVWGQHDNPPRGGWYPLSLWLPDEAVLDDYAVRIDPETPPGDYQLIVGMYDPATGARIGIHDGSGRGGDFVPVATISVFAR